MNSTAQRTPRLSLVRQLQRCRLIVGGLIAAIFLVSIPVILFVSPSQHTLDTQQGALQEDLNSILLGMLNQESGLRGYITTANTTFLQPFSNGRPQYLLAEQRLASQTRGSDFQATAKALALVDERATAWYHTYAQVQLHNMQTGQLATARATTSNTFGKALFDQFRAAVANLQVALDHDLAALQSRLQIFVWLIFVGIALLAVGAVIVLWRTLTRFLQALRAQLDLLISTTTVLGSGDLSARVQELTYDELNRLGQTFNEMAQDLEVANRARNQFLSTMSHELRTPLASIIGFSQLLLDAGTSASLSQQQQGNLSRILKNGQHLLSLVSDVLDLEKIEAGAMELTYGQVDVRDLLTSIVEETQSLAIARHLVLRAELADGVGSLESDALKLRQILLNLVSNAIKFTEQGEVTVSAAESGTDHLVFSVRDTGIGIPAEVLERVFDPFYQVDGSYKRKAGGTGLGLSIVSRLTNLLGGTIQLDSTPGQGSTFTVTLPRRSAHPPIEPALPRLHSRPAQQATTTVLPSQAAPMLVDLPSGRVAAHGLSEAQERVMLAVDDNPDVFPLIEAALQDTPYRVIGVQDPFQVMNLVQTLHPIAITLDVMMPDFNGWQLLHQLRATPATASIPVVMLTVLPEQTTGYVLGADEFLIKPFKSEALLAALQRVITIQQEPSQASTRETQPV